DGSEYIIPRVWCIGSMIPDFTSKEATKYWFDRFDYLKKIGIDGFKTDGGEFVHETDTIFSNGLTGIEGINAYPEMYEEAFSNFIGDKGIIYSRAGGVKTPLNSILWAGDQESTWDEFRAMVKAGLSSGMSGISAWGYDIAGFSGYLPTRSLYLRSVQFASFIPIMQWHSDPVSNNRCDFSGAWKCNDRSPWNMARYLKDDKLIDLLRKKFDMHYNLLPYQYMLMVESSETGIPAMRHLALEFEDDKNTYNIENEFMLGESLLVCPVLDDYINEAEIYLPKGNWYNIYTNELFKGGKHKVSLSDELIPVYMKDNSCIPLNLKGGVIESSVGNAMDSYQELTFLVSGKGSFKFSDDLGNEIDLTWDKDSYQELSNKLGIKYNVLHIEKDKIYRG
ncbi:MAG: glycoside hydrolase family 31 protein, partial [Bacilli bacterium]|nr:glycoside hydrolase family 31 protein [Bacilli bacterium]